MTEKAPELLPCPFCADGGRPAFHPTKGVKCHKCGAWGPDMDNSEPTAWNTRAPQWRPISEAPRDGTPILVFGQPEKHPHLNSWFERPVCIAAYWCAIDDAFCIMGGDWLGPFVNPTHFMPLPEAPNEP